ncbi:9663_t:CDS:2 [Paraglomus occultum]|uniref:9663_t:CDS:1 n=1 Tax=Paraglomus occultum TaxID=144539 RepID=A0A9N9BPB7_9GLOM|nr:9663_t:CDS:2 [Paraglomus occultum]
MPMIEEDMPVIEEDMPVIEEEIPVIEEGMPVIEVEKDGLKNRWSRRDFYRSTVPTVFVEGKQMLASG